MAISTLGEWYNDLLAIDSWINGRSKAAQARSLLCSKLQEREELVKQRVEYLAKKRGISPNDMWTRILDGSAEKMSPDNSDDEEGNK